jgi:hypothetical protein
VKASHNLDRLGVTFDDLGLVADAGLLLTATLAQRLGLRATLDRRLKLGRVAGAAIAGQKAMTLIASILAGGDTIDDANALRAGSAGPYSVTARRHHRRWERSCVRLPRATRVSSTRSRKMCCRERGTWARGRPARRPRSTSTPRSSKPMVSTSRVANRTPLLIQRTRLDSDRDRHYRPRYARTTRTNASPGMAPDLSPPKNSRQELSAPVIRFREKSRLATASSSVVWN